MNKRNLKLSKKHTLEAIPENMVRGYLDPFTPPVLTVNSGDTVTLHNVWALSPEGLPNDEVADAIKCADKALGPVEVGVHFLTGPVAVHGAVPGDVLEVRILDVQLKSNWGWNMIKQNAGSLPGDFGYNKQIIIPLDTESMTGSWLNGINIKLEPFFGIMGVAPPKAEGKKESLVPAKWGGNLDIKVLKKGATLYLPVWTEDALFFAGDGHAAQGDGEVCLTAIETSLKGVFQLTIRRDMKLETPFAETPSHFVTIGFDPVLEKAFEKALRQMIDFISHHWGLSREDAYRLCSTTVDFHISQVVNPHKGVHGLLPKSIFKKQ
jgi:acetamidase/formamidase